jgi:zinc transport system ATP-binding protein
VAEPLLDLRGIRLARDGTTILEDVDLSVSAGEIVTLVGQNGAGKSTLVKVALGLLEPDRGEIRRRPDLRIGYQPQKLAMDAAMPMPVRRFLTLTHRASAAAIAAVLASVGMDDMADADLGTLSGGELQRVLLARAMVREPELLVLDEPTQNVDMAGAVDIYRVIAALRDRTGCGVLLISHDLSIVMAQTSRVYCLNGHVCCSGLPADVSRNPEFVRLFGPAAAGMLTIYPHDHDHDHAPGHHAGHGHDHHRRDHRSHGHDHGA